MDQGKVAVRKVVAPAPQPGAPRVKYMMSTIYKVTWGISSTRLSCPRFLWGMWARNKRAGFCCFGWLSAHIYLPCCWGEDYQHCFCSTELNLHLWRYSPTVAMSLLCTHSTVCQSPSCTLSSSSNTKYDRPCLPLFSLANAGLPKQLAVSITSISSVVGQSEHIYPSPKTAGSVNNVYIFSSRPIRAYLSIYPTLLMQKFKFCFLCLLVHMIPK